GGRGPPQPPPGSATAGDCLKSSLP
ncbi:hypothetical protein A2U01_0060174, partial [Trifolium medium]|nr:hypothetical protein [Trifolium medium]